MMCQVHIGAYVSLLAPGKTDYTACHPRKTTYILHVVPITTHTHVRRKSVGTKRQRKDKKRQERKGKERKERKAKKERKEKKRQEKQEKTRQEDEAGKGKEKKCHAR